MNTESKPNSRVVVSGDKWSRVELILAFNLYCQIPFGMISWRNLRIKELAELLGRTANSIALRLVNFASHDPALQARGVRGMSGGGRAVGEIWAEFAADPERLAFESERLLATRLGKPVEEVAEIVVADLPPDLVGREREALVRMRVNQGFFRKRVLSAYDYRCCVTGLAVPELLVASHIVPWAADPANRMNPRNGLCLNALHDRLFDRGLMWVDAGMVVRLAPALGENPGRMPTETLAWLHRFADRPLLLPKRFTPDPELLRRHAVGCEGVGEKGVGETL